MAKSSSARIQASKAAGKVVKERFRGSSDLPLTAKGVVQIRTLAREIAKKGGLSVVYTSNLQRTRRTAEIIANATGAKVKINPNLVDWRLGGLEGLPVNDETIAFQNRLIEAEPDRKVPGRGPISTADGESFNTFRKRGVDQIRWIFDQVKQNPVQRSACIINFRFVKLQKAFLADGGLTSDNIDVASMVKYLKSNDMSPGSMERAYFDVHGQAKMEPIDVFRVKELPAGMYMIRHGQTPWNKPEDDDEDADE